MSACTRRSDCGSWVHYPECPAKFTSKGIVYSGIFGDDSPQRQPPPDFFDGAETVVLPAKQNVPGMTDLMVAPEVVDEWLQDNPPPVTIPDPEFPWERLWPDEVEALRGGTPDRSTARASRLALAQEMIADLEEAVEHIAGDALTRKRIAANIERYKSTTDCTYTLLEVKEMGWHPPGDLAERLEQAEVDTERKVDAKLREKIVEQEQQLLDARELLARFEYLPYGAHDARFWKDGVWFTDKTVAANLGQPTRAQCTICTWPEEGHNGPGRIHGNAENTHEEGCSMYAVLHGEPANRLRTRRTRSTEEVLISGNLSIPSHCTVGCTGPHHRSECALAGQVRYTR